MKRSSLFFLMLTISASYCSQVTATECTFDSTSGTIPKTFTLPAQTIFIDADAPNDTTKAIATYDTSTQGTDVSFHNCTTADIYGKDTSLTTTQNPQTKLFPTSITGISMKVLWNNGAAFGDFPSQGNMSWENSSTLGRWVYPGASYFRVQFFKTADTLDLSSHDGDQVIPAEAVAYTWATNSRTVVQSLNIGQIEVVSTPSCSYESSKTVDFNTVSSRTLTSGGIDRNLNFNILCKTDYGNYSATASLSSDNKTDDNNYIKVSDANGSNDVLAIKISDSSGNIIKTDGSSSETIDNVKSGSSADFKWIATLVSLSGSKKPANGNFSSNAEITLQVK